MSKAVQIPPESVPTVPTGTALIAMSGGVDSSVAAWLLKEQGYDCTGAMMKLYAGEEIAERGCCSIADAQDAQSVAFRMDIPFYVFNFADDFTQQVIGRFIDAYQNGRTPNPCIDCNRYLKFERFLGRAKELGCEKVATGHYAQITYESGRWLLKKGLDASKDQSYFLYAMTQPQLADTLFPLGALTKDEVREIAEAKGFVNAKKRDSQDICFAPNGDYAGFIVRTTGQAPAAGPFLDGNGNRLGEHKGIIHYTVGQRKGLGISAAHPLYVTELRPNENAVELGREDKLFSKTLIARDLNLIATPRIERPTSVTAKIRYRHTEQPATAWQLDDDTLKVEFDQPQRAITKGQAVVLYDGDIVVGGGVIDE
ncbi:MAG: tRNA 2-thiouridine(34) synthase MnmA [Oscillospiraceae bacterium]|nr:tRNA 2-thiouridine(34) synthase MnmA [Oscillospiraceae bacterium]